jgi:hypothetical protein
MRSFASVAAFLDHDVWQAFDPSVANRNEAGRKAAEMNKHLVEAESLVQFGFPEDAQTRYESATMAAADSLLALCGGRLVNSYRGRAHEVKKHFLVVALTAEGKPAPSLEQVLSITHIRHLVEYGASLVDDQLTPNAADEARKAANSVRKSVLDILSEAGVTVPQLPV